MNPLQHHLQTITRRIFGLRSPSASASPPCPRTQLPDAASPPPAACPACRTSPPRRKRVTSYLFQNGPLSDSGPVGTTSRR